MKKFLISFLALLTFSCTHLDRTVTLNVASNAGDKTVNVGNGKKIEIIVIDERKHPQIIGKKRFGSQVVKVTSEPELTQFLQEKFTESFKQRGFEIAQEKTLVIYLNRFKYSSGCGFLMGKSSLEGKVVATVIDKRGNEIFRKKFSISSDNSHFIISSEAKDAELINFALQELHNEILEDKSLIQSLQL